MKALILASAPCVWADFRAAIALGGYDKIYAVNQTGIRLAFIDTWVSAHAENMPKWQKMRAACGYDLPEVVCWNMATRGYSAVIHRTHQLRWPGMDSPSAGGSSLLAVRVALDDGASKVVVCGAPLDASGNIGANGGTNGDYSKFIEGWRWAHSQGYLDAVKSMSGKTADLLGKPTKHWLSK